MTAIPSLLATGFLLLVIVSIILTTVGSSYKYPTMEGIGVIGLIICILTVVVYFVVRLWFV
jgi:uncharacterized membrane protein